MLDRITKAAGDILSIARDIEQLKRDVAGLRDDVNVLMEKMTAFTFELQRDRERAQYERELQERKFENLLLRLELALEKSGRQLPSSGQNSDEPKQLP